MLQAKSRHVQVKLVWYVREYYRIHIIYSDFLGDVQSNENMTSFENISIRVAVVFMGPNSTGIGRQLRVCGPKPGTPVRMDGTRIGLMKGIST